MDWSNTLVAIRSMSLDDRIRMVEAIWDDIAADRAFPSLTEAQKRELDRRLADDEENPDDVVTWESIMEHGRKKR
jgi:putative addiction module component (TIGR02574 family)